MGREKERKIWIENNAIFTQQLTADTASNPISQPQRTGLDGGRHGAGRR
jgi:hypothetical protein